MLVTLKFWDNWELDIIELGVDEFVFPWESQLPGSFDDGAQPHYRQWIKDKFEA